LPTLLGTVEQGVESLAIVYVFGFGISFDLG
jgi:hypothetical protein